MGWLSAIGDFLAGLFTLATFLVAVVAVRHAKDQVEAAQDQLNDAAEDRRRTEEATQERIRVEPDPARGVEAVRVRLHQGCSVGGLVIELVIKNFGRLPALDRKVTITPTPRATTSRGPSAIWRFPKRSPSSLRARSGQPCGMRAEFASIPT